jgi:hypothetical protein
MFKLRKLPPPAASTAANAVTPAMGQHQHTEA